MHAENAAYFEMERQSLDKQRDRWCRSLTSSRSSWECSRYKFISIAISLATCACFFPHALRQPQHNTRLLSSLAACVAESQIISDGLHAAQEAERRHVPACAFARMASAKCFRQGGERGILSLFPPCSRRCCRRIMNLETTLFLKQTGIRFSPPHIACCSVASHV
jgi:hypothetical protein